MSYTLRHLQSSNFTQGAKCARVFGVARGIDFYVIHHWGVPSNYSHANAFDNVVAWLRGASGGQSNRDTSAHEVVEAGRVTTLVHPGDASWAAGEGRANARSYQLELHPRAWDSDYETAAERLADLWIRDGGEKPLRRHGSIVNTACPGAWDLSRLVRLARQKYRAKTNPAPRPASSSSSKSKVRPAGKGPWPTAYLTPTDKFNEWQEKALFKLLGDAGYTGATLAIRLQKRLKASGDYTGRITSQSRIGPKTVRAWQSFLSKRTNPKTGRRFYTGKVTMLSRWGPQTNRATVDFLNWQAEQY